MKKIPLFLLLLFLPQLLTGQVYLHEFSDSITSPYRKKPNTLDPNLSNSEWNSSTGAFISYGGNSGSALCLSNSSGTPTYTLTFTIANGCTLDLTSFNFWQKRSNTGASSSSMTINNTAVGSYSVTTGGAFIGSTSLSGFTGLTNTVTVVLSLSGASGTGTFRLDDFELKGTTSCGSSNTITTGATTGAPYTVACPSTTASGSVLFTSTGVFTASNVYTAQLSNEIGLFTSPTNIGTLTSTLNFGSVNIVIPANTISGSGYKIRIVSSHPATYGSPSSSFSIAQSGACTSPYLTSLIYDGCNVGGCSEGDSEIAFGNTAQNSLVISAQNININYYDYDLVGSVIEKTATTTGMNSQAGCPGLFLDAFGLRLNPNSKFMIVPSDICLSAFDWSNLCGSGPIYVIYAESGISGDTWRNGGNFGNTGTQKDFSVDFISSNGAKRTSYSYDPPSSSTDGNYATYSSQGGDPATQGNFPSCAISAFALSTELLLFKAENLDEKTGLYWRTASEINNEYFIIEHSTNGYNWKTLDRIQGAWNSTTPKDYFMMHDSPAHGMNYYKLKSIDFNGKIKEEGLISFSMENNQPFATYNGFLKSIVFQEHSSVDIYSLEGKKLYSGENETIVPFSHTGVFIIHNYTSKSNQRMVIN